jgi:putative nucleotidyltransferase with HDIG domain
MHHLIEWFTHNYPHIKSDMRQCTHTDTISEINPYHIEDDCWSHTMLVCKIAEIARCDRDVLVAALLHDIGKPTAREVNPFNKHVRFFDHEKISAKLSQPILEHMCSDKLIDRDDKETIIELIAKHGDFYRYDSVDEIIEEYRDRLYFLQKLVSLVECDNQGRFYLNDNTKVLSLIDGIKKYLKRHNMSK